MNTEIEWRRKWRPDLKACPWQPISIEDKPYLFKCRFTHDSYELFVTDLNQFWFEKVEDAALRKRVQKLNPSIEASSTRILDQIQNCLESPGKETTVSVSFKRDDSGEKSIMTLKLQSQLAGMPFLWHFRAYTADSNLVSENLIIPLLAMVGELNRRQREMVKILEAKDKEIDDYKSQGVKTSRKHIETAPFVITAFENDMLMSKAFEEEVKNLGSSGFSEDIQDLYRQIMTKHAWMNRPEVYDPSEEAATNDTSLEDQKGSSATSWGTGRLPPSLANRKSPSKSPVKSPAKSPSKGTSSTESTPSKEENAELLRRQALERKLEEDERKKQEPKKKKKKIAF